MVLAPIFHAVAGAAVFTTMSLIIGSLGHAMVLTALTYVRSANGAGQIVNAIVRDPWPQRGKRFLSPQEWFQANFLARIRVL